MTGHGEGSFSHKSRFPFPPGTLSAYLSQPMITDQGAQLTAKPYGIPDAPTVVRRLACLFVFLLGLLPSLARAEITGAIESVGFDQTFRPGAWTPLVVRLRPDAGSSGTYQLRVEQEDLDRDLISFVRTITLTAPSASAGGIGSDQRFVVYFLPEGARNRDGRGLPDKFQSSRLDQLDAQLRVYLCNDKGQKLQRIPVGSMIGSLEPIEARRGAKLILYVRENNSSPARRDFAPNITPLLGVTEDFVFIEVSPKTLPTSVLGYESVDAVVWATGGPPDRAVASEEPRYRALREWLGAGGRLVVMQYPEWRKTAAWGDLLPVTFPAYGDVQGIAQRSDLKLLQQLAIGNNAGTLENLRLWTSLKGPHNYGVAQLRPGAMMDKDDEIDWDNPPSPEMPKQTPWLARQAVGAGCVTYVAQDLGSPLLSPMLPPPGWPKIWNHVLDYKAVPFVVTKETKDDDRVPVAMGTAAHDLGRQVFNRMALTSRAGTLVSVAILFFILYWAAAGPGSWFLLRLRGKREYSWLAFAAIAGGATLVTVLVVRLVLRGAPELRHFSLVRVIPNEPTLVQSRMGLYIPRDGDQHIALPPGAADYNSVISPYAIHPYHSGDVDEFPAFRQYTMPVPDSSGDTPAAIDVPYRSTEKRLQLSWRGELKQKTVDAPIAITGQVSIPPPSALTLLSGNLTNSSGADLQNVMLIFNSRLGYSTPADRVVFIPLWKDGAQISLDTLTNQKTGTAKLIDSPKPGGSSWTPDANTAIYGAIETVGNNAAQWTQWFRNPVRSGNMMVADSAFDDGDQAIPRGYALLSLFDRLPFFQNGQSYTRAELRRTNARFLDVSTAISAGRLVILGQGPENAPLPVPLTVDGEAVAGTGTTLYQFILPLDHSKDKPEEDEPTTQPSANPTSRPSSSTPVPASPPSTIFPTPRN